VNRCVLLSALAVVGCASASPVAKATSGPKPDVPAALSDVDPELARVSRVRGMPALAPVAVIEVSRGELVRHALRQVDAEAPDGMLRERGRILEILQLVPAGFDFRDALETLLDQTLVGLYDPVGARVLVANDAPGTDSAATRYHELAHALADQHFDLEARIGFEERGADRQSATASLSEGDASSVMFDLASEDQAATRSVMVEAFLATLDVERLDRTGLPRVVARLLAAPYIDGIEFVERLRSQGGWEKVNAAWAEPPTTTEQVLHSDAYERREPGLAVRAPEPHPGCKRVYSDVLGEQTLRCMAAEWIGPEAARDAFRGWGGDEVSSFACPEGPVLVVALAGDDASALLRMLNAFDAGGRANGCLGVTVPLGSERVNLLYAAPGHCPVLLP
jgi:hypothetical protein